MKNVIYFCIGFMLLLIYRKYQERMGNISAKKPENGNFGSSFSTFRVYQYGGDVFGGYGRKLDIRQISGKEVKIEDLHSSTNEGFYVGDLFKVVHNLNTSFYKVEFEFPENVVSQPFMIVNEDKNSFIVRCLEHCYIDMTLSIVER